MWTQRNTVFVDLAISANCYKFITLRINKLQAIIAAIHLYKVTDFFFIANKFYKVFYVIK